MSKFFEKHAHFEGSEKEAKKMKLCVRCLDRLIKDDYFDTNNVLQKKWGKWKFEEVPNELGRLLLDIRRENIKTEEDEEQYNKEFKKFADISYYSEERDIRLLFKVINQNIQKWWD